MPTDPELEHDPAAGDPPPEVIDATTADGDEVPDTSDGVPQHHAPAKGSPS